MSFAQILATDSEAPLERPRGEAACRGRAKFGIIGSVILVGAALIVVLAPTSVPVNVSSDLPDSVVSLGKFTSPYYMIIDNVKTRTKPTWCPEGEMIKNKEDCFAAGKVLGKTQDFVEESSQFVKKGCTADHSRTVFNSKFDSNENRGDVMCKTKPEGMPDFAALKSDLKALTWHCIDKTHGDFGQYTQCMIAIHTWSGSSSQSDDGGEGSQSDGGEGDVVVVQEVKVGYCRSDRVGLGADLAHGTGNPSLKACAALARDDVRCSGDGYFDAVKIGGSFQCKCPMGKCIGATNPTSPGWKIYKS